MQQAVWKIGNADAPINPPMIESTARFKQTVAKLIASRSDWQKRIRRP
jgi:hypothetical protein